ncbi:MAG: hypothetical protein Q8P18_01785 [Pseudomonadota bacterium]|nr:hypothetical protein [Pseudomonadota bacterium]
MLLSLSVLTHAALAADGPSLYFRQTIGAAVYSTGALSATRLELRTPLHRSDSVVFKATYAGAGVGLQVSPAFVGVGPRISIAPIDVFDLNLSAARMLYFDGGLGLMTFDETSGRTGDQRNARSDDGFGSGAWVATAEPTLKLKLGPLVAFGAWAVDLVHLERPADIVAPYTYEPLRGLVIAFDDVLVEQQVGLLYDALPEDGPSLRVGLIGRDRFAVVSGDRTTSAGLMVAARPGIKPAVPTLVAMAQLFFTDPDREVLSPPNIAIGARWEIDAPLTRSPIPELSP